MSTFAISKKQRSPKLRPARRALSPPAAIRQRGPQSAQKVEIHQSLQGPHLQKKLIVGEPDDKFEREADRVADQVMRLPEPQVPMGTLQFSEDERVQRACKECEQELRWAEAKPEEKKVLRAKALAPQRDAVGEVRRISQGLEAAQGAAERPGLSPDFANKVRATRGGGRPL